jgi:hypothetical protein
VRGIEIWDKEAQYYYCAHRPVARLEKGEYKLQGLDYLNAFQG